MYTNKVFGTAKCVLFIEVSSFQNVELYCALILLCAYSSPWNMYIHVYLLRVSRLERF